MNEREQLLAGRTSVNRREFDARETSEEAATNVGAGVAGEPDKWESGEPRDPVTCVPADTSDLQADEGSLEAVFRSQVVSKYKIRDSLESEIPYCESQLTKLFMDISRVKSEIAILEEVLYDNYRGEERPDRTVPEEEQCSGDKTEEVS